MTRVEHPGPVHRFLARWLREHGYFCHDGREHPCLTDDLVRAVSEQVDAGREGFGWLRDAHDLDREVRALVGECLALSALGFGGLYILSGPRGYWYGDPDCYECTRIADAQDLVRLRAHAQKCRDRRLAREAERRYQAGERRIVQPEMAGVS